jgi:hypothetical protein
MASVTEANPGALMIRCDTGTAMTPPIAMPLDPATHIARLVSDGIAAFDTGQTVLLLGDTDDQTFTARAAIISPKADVDLLRAGVFALYRWRHANGLRTNFGDHRALGAVVGVEPLTVRVGKQDCPISLDPEMVVARLEPASEADIYSGAKVALLGARLPNGANGAGTVVISGL